MGNSNTVIDFEYKIAANDYKPQQKIKDPRLGELVQMKNTKTGHFVLMREKRFANSETYNQKIEECVNQLTLKHHNLAKIYGFAGADAQETFNNRYKIYVYFESLQDNLQKSINARKVPLDLKNNTTAKNSGQFFSEAELLSTTHQLVDVLDYLQQNGVSHGEIKPENCFISKEGTAKVFNQKLIYDDVSAYELVRQGNRRIFVTPIALEALKKKQSEPIEDQYKADVFRLGLTLLECATLKPSSLLYDWNNYTINRNTLSSRLLETKERYSRNFYEILGEMLCLQEERRPDFRALKLDLADRGRMSIASICSHQSNEEGSSKKQSLSQFELNKIPKLQSNINTENYKPIDLKLNKANISSSSNLNTNSKPVPKPDGPKQNEKMTERTGRFGKKVYQEENMEDDVGASEGNVKINKVLERAVHRSADKFRPTSLLNTEESAVKIKGVILGGAQSEYQMPVPGADKKQQEQTSIYGKLKDKFSKLRGASSQNTRTRDGNNERQFRRNESEVAQSMGKIAFSNKLIKPISTEISLDATDHSLLTSNSRAPADNKDQYTYEERKKQRTEFSVERLMQEAVKRSEKHQTSITDQSDSSTYCQTEPGFLYETKERDFMNPVKSATTAHTIKTRIIPPPLSSIQLSNSYGLPTNFFSGTLPKPNVLKQTPLTPSNISTIGRRSPLDVNFPLNIPYTVIQSPSYAMSQQSSLPMSSYSSFAGNEMLKSTNRLQVMDLAPEINESNKALIDNIVKPPFLTTKHDENKHFFPKRTFTPTVNVDIRTLQKPIRANTLNENIKRQKEENTFPTHIKPEGFFANQPTGKENENRENYDMTLRMYVKSSSHKDVYSQAPKDCTNTIRPLGNHDFNYEGTGKGHTDQGKSEEMIEDEIQKAIERSRKTYEFAKNIPVQLVEPEGPRLNYGKAGSEIKARYLS